MSTQILYYHIAFQLIEVVFGWYCGMFQRYSSHSAGDTGHTVLGWPDTDDTSGGATGHL